MDKLVWIDLETTGLDQAEGMLGCREHLILEIGLHITDSNFNILDEGLQIPIHYRKAEIDYRINDFVRDMHTKNGLLDDVEASEVGLFGAEKIVIDYLKQHGVKKGKSPICGNNVGFDKNFISAQMPDLADYLHYRKLDVSTINEIAKALSPEVTYLVRVLKDNVIDHRALADIKLSIGEMQIYRDFFFNYRRG